MAPEIAQIAEALRSKYAEELEERIAAYTAGLAAEKTTHNHVSQTFNHVSQTVNQTVNINIGTRPVDRDDEKHRTINLFMEEDLGHISRNEIAKIVQEIA